MFLGKNSEDAYKPLASSGEDGNSEGSLDETPRHSTRGSRKSRRLCHLMTALVVLLAAAVGFVVGVFHGRNDVGSWGGDTLRDTAPRIPLPTVQGEFIYNSPFSEEPPQGEGSGNASEPNWDALVPNGLGYFKDGHFAPQVSIPTVIHQLHCLYIIRRAYYSGSEDLQEFDFGKDRSAHAAHCFDYLQQSLTCSSDTTVEPAINDPNGFLGSGFARQCRDFGRLREFLEEHRAFNATGFLAHGLDHGHAHIDSS